MTVDTIESAEPLLADIVDNLESNQELEGDLWLGKRSAKRYRLSVPVWIRPFSETGLGRAYQCQLTNISSSGVGLFSRTVFECEQPVQLELCVNNVHWKGTMWVAHCTQTINGYVVGLELRTSSTQHSLPYRTEEQSTKCLNTPDPIVEKPTKCLNTPVDIERLKQELRTLILNHRLSTYTMGLIGKSIDKKICSAIRKLSCNTSDRDDSLWKHRRRNIMNNVTMLIPDSDGWERLHPNMLHGKQGPITLLFTFDSLNEQSDHIASGVFDITPGTVVIIGLETDDGMLWAPAEITYCTNIKNEFTCINIEFNTFKSQEYILHI
ncbi:MAG: hypothetical protein ACYTBZ_21300 [Planctomycetota bacterium]|jgi:hypothetical protein